MLINYIIVNIDKDVVWLMETDLMLINYIIVNNIRMADGRSLLTLTKMLYG